MHFRVAAPHPGTVENGVFRAQSGTINPGSVIAQKKGFAWKESGLFQDELHRREQALEQDVVEPAASDSCRGYAGRIGGPHITTVNASDSCRGYAARIGGFPIITVNRTQRNN